MSDLLNDETAVWRRATADGFTLRLHVQPGAKKTELVGEYNGALKVRLAAPPVDGKANEALCRFLADSLGVPLRNVSIERGHGAREKVIRIQETGDRRQRDTACSSVPITQHSTERRR